MKYHYASIKHPVYGYTITSLQKDQLPGNQCLRTLPGTKGTAIQQVIPRAIET